MSTPWSTVGYLTYKRTYSRRLVEDDVNGPTEEWEDTINRCLNACESQLNIIWKEDERERLYNYLHKLKASFAGRFLWQLGTATVDKLGLPSLQNCAACVVDEPIRPFTWCMDRLMLGCGVGFNIQREYVYKLPSVREGFKSPTRDDTPDADFIVPDTREGWVSLLERTLKSAFFNDKVGFTYSTQLIRSKGAPIKGFGGVASGPEDLCWGISEISKVLVDRSGKQLRPIDCLDIMNIIGAVVVAGNVRRSAQIAIGDSDDLQFLSAKNWSKGNIPNWRSNSNNSVVCNDIRHLPQEFWKTYEGDCEPYGLINLKLSRNRGRTYDSQYKDKEVVAYNPCGEQSLARYETCCLAEVFLPNVDSYEELLDVVKLLYKVNKHSLSLPDAASIETQDIVHKNMRMGIGVTGYLQASEEQRTWLPLVYDQLREFDKQYSKKYDWPESIKLTTCKPSGTLSLLPGVTPGVHPGYAGYMIRRISVSANNPLVNVCIQHGYPVEFRKKFDGTYDRSTVLVEFPFSFPEGTVVAKDLSAIDQLEYVKRLQTEWSDNSVSCTVYYKKEELDDIKAYLEKNYNKNFKTLSFLLHSEHGFIQAPYEEISKEEHERRVKNVKLITNISNFSETDFSEECTTGVCPIR
jgi:ribonucleoside-triphosphate reductase